MSIPQILAMYLPQFHEIEENNKWWGKGFTEWTTVKAAKSLYEGHKQPIQPLEYYDLLDKKVMEKQAEYMHKYGVDGMCFYHYYFEDGKKILEKPAENLLKWSDVNMPFCFCWENGSWVRSWSNVQGNSWTELFEPKKYQEKDDILLKQDYGERKEWETHFYYLLPFFKDNRYLKKDGHPIFIIYQPLDISCLKEMKKCWNELMIREGMPSIYFIGRGTDCGVLESTLIHQPIDAWEALTDKRFQNEYGLQFYLDYDDVWEKILKKHYTQKNVCLGGFVGFDDTPRRGYKGRVIYGSTPQKFNKYMIRLLLKAKFIESEYVFINAWNEWGEGMYLEPDQQWGFQYLEALYDAKRFVDTYGEILSEALSDNSCITEDNNEEIVILSKKIDRYKTYWNILNRWLNLKLLNKSICDYFIYNNYNRVAIYGIGMLGSTLVKEMQNYNIPIAYGIDQDVYKGRKFDFPIYQLQDSLPEVDLIVVTVRYIFEDVKRQLQERGCKNIVSLENIIMEMT